MTQTNLLKIFLSLSLLLNCWMFLHRPTEIVYEGDERILKENKQKELEIKKLQLQMDSLKSIRLEVKERIVYRTKELKKDEKIINDADITQLDSIIRTGL